MVADGLVALGLGREDLLRELHRDLVRRGLVRQRGRGLPTLEEGAVAADAHDDVLAVGVLADADGAHGAGVDVLGLLLEHRAQPRGDVEPALVELLQVREHLVLAAGDRVEGRLHGGREAGVDEVPHVLLHERHHGEGRERGDQG